jgi:hypothetical protein
VLEPAIAAFVFRLIPSFCHPSDSIRFEGGVLLIKVASVLNQFDRSWVVSQEQLSQWRPARHLTLDVQMPSSSRASSRPRTPVDAHSMPPNEPVGERLSPVLVLLKAIAENGTFTPLYLLMLLNCLTPFNHFCFRSLLLHQMWLNFSPRLLLFWGLWFLLWSPNWMLVANTPP